MSDEITVPIINNTIPSASKITDENGDIDHYSMDLVEFNLIQEEYRRLSMYVVNNWNELDQDVYTAIYSRLNELRKEISYRYPNLDA
jgi:hypothetical protein